MLERFQILVWLVGPWETFHRRPMLEALAVNAHSVADVLCVNHPLSWRELWAQGRRATFQAYLDNPHPNLWVSTPVIWLPSSGRFRWMAPLVGNIIASQVGACLRKLDGANGPRVAWVYRPEQLNLLGLIGENYVVYECYDAYTLSITDGRPIAGMAEQETTLLDRTDLVFATSEPLVTHCQEGHPNVHYALNGANVALFSRRASALPTEMRALHAPRIGYIGSVTAFLDLALVERLAMMAPEWSFVLIGPIHSTVQTQVNALQRRYGNIYFLGRKSQRDLPAYLQACDVIMLPFKTNAYLQHSNPLVLWECMATGKPIVITRLEIVSDLVDVVYVADDAEMFAQHIRWALQTDDIERQRRQIDVARDHSWPALTRRVPQQLQVDLAAR